MKYSWPSTFAGDTFQTPQANVKILRMSAAVLTVSVIAFCKPHNATFTPF